MKIFKCFLKFVLYVAFTAGFSSAQADVYVDFFRAVDRDDTRTVSWLLGRGFDPNSVNERGRSALMLSLSGESTAVAMLLLNHPDIRIDDANPVGETPLMMAALKGHEDAARRLLEKGAAVHKAGWSPVHYAATGPATRLLQTLLDRGAPLDARSPTGATPLMMAARYAPESSVDLLLGRGADAGARDDLGRTAADWAALEGRDFLVERLRVARR